LNRSRGFLFPPAKECHQEFEQRDDGDHEERVEALEELGRHQLHFLPLLRSGRDHAGDVSFRFRSVEVGRAGVDFVGELEGVEGPVDDRRVDLALGVFFGPEGQCRRAHPVDGEERHDGDKEDE